MEKRSLVSRERQNAQQFGDIADMSEKLRTICLRREARTAAAGVGRGVLTEW